MKSVSGQTHKSNRVDELIVNGTSIRNSDEIAELFNHHFVSLANLLTIADESLLEPSSSLNQSLFIIPEITANDVEKIIQKISISKATGPDRVSVKLIKAGAKAIAPSLAKLFNLCFSTVSFPQIWKIAKVIPSFKGVEKSNVDNYRPISILPIISNIIERHAPNSLVNNTQDRNFICHLQSGFKRNYSTEMVLIRVVDQLLFSQDDMKFRVYCL